MPSIYSVPAARQRGRVSPLADELSAIFSAIDDEPLLSALTRYRWTVTASKKGISAHQVDETYVGGKPRYRQPRKGARAMDDPSAKAPVVSFLERNGRVRSMHVERVTSSTLGEAIDEMVDSNAELHTDAARVYIPIGRRREGEHHTVNHGSHEYARGHVTTNTVEGYFATLKRGVYGTFHHISKDHLHRYLAEFDFRYNHREATDGQRMAAAVRAGEGKRLKWRDVDRPGD